jgi:hypothetical protein
MAASLPWALSSGVTLIYGILRFSNFAHGDTMAFGAMVTILFTWLFQAMGSQPWPAAHGPAGPALRHPGLHGVAAGPTAGVYRFYRAQKGQAGDPGDRVDGRDVHHERASCASSSGPMISGLPMANGSSSRPATFAR